MRVTLPSWPAMRLPGNTRPGSCAWPVEPGALCDRELPWLARLDEKWWRLMAPEKPLPFDVPVHVDLLAHVEDVHADLAADLEAGQLLLGDAEFAERCAGLDARLGEMARHAPW